MWYAHIHTQVDAVFFSEHAIRDCYFIACVYDFNYLKKSVEHSSEIGGTSLYLIYRINMKSIFFNPEGHIPTWLYQILLTHGSDVYSIPVYLYTCILLTHGSDVYSIPVYLYTCKLLTQSSDVYSIPVYLYTCILLTHSLTCPNLYTRKIDWMSWEGFHEASKIITLLADTRLIPREPALVEIKNSLAL